MVEQQRQRIEQEMTKLVNDVERLFLRKMQATMHLCAARCCDNMDATIEGVQRCVANCTRPFEISQEYVHSEIKSFENRLQRCVMECNDDIKLKMGPNPTETEILKFTAQFETCATKCVDKYIELIPQISKAIKTVLSKQQKEQQ